MNQVSCTRFRFPLFVKYFVLRPVITLTLLVTAQSNKKKRNHTLPIQTLPIKTLRKIIIDLYAKILPVVGLNLELLLAYRAFIHLFQALSAGDTNFHDGLHFGHAGLGPARPARTEARDSQPETEPHYNLNLPLGLT